MADQNSKLFCSFCSQSQEQTRQLIAGPNQYICNECIIAFTHPLVNAPKTDIPEKRCDFCGKLRSEVVEIIEVKDQRICNECLTVCIEIINVK